MKKGYESPSIGIIYCGSQGILTGSAESNVFTDGIGIEWDNNKWGK